MHTRRTVVAVVALCALFVSAWMLPGVAASEGAREPAARPLAEMAVGASRVDWQPAGDYEHLTLTVAGSDGLWFRKEFAAGEPATLSLIDQNGQQLPDGAYSYELRFVARKEGNLPERSLLQGGSFSVRSGSFSVTFEEGKGSRDVGTAAMPPIQNITAETQVIAEDLVVQGAACVGDDCTSGDAGSGGFLKLKNNFTSIVFEDVTDGVTPARDWAIVPGPWQGAIGDGFVVKDVDASTTPFAIRGNASDLTLVVGTGGKVGIGTSLPDAPLHLYADATSDAYIGIGLDPASGPAFNVGYGGGSFGRGAGYLNVRPDASATAPNPSLRFLTANVQRMIVTNTGDVGIGTTSPSVPLHVSRSTGAVLEGIRLTNNNEGRIAIENTAQSTKYIMGVNNTNPALFFISRDGGGGTIVEVNKRLDAGGVPSLSVKGSVEATNVVFSSSRSLKEDIRPLDPQEVLARVANLPIAEWRFKEGPEQVRHIGPMAEDFHDAFGLSPNRETISVTDTSGVAFAAIQGLHQRIEELEKQNAALMRRLRALENVQVPSAEP